MTTDAPARSTRRLPAGTDAPLTARYDVALLDLDGVVYVGSSALPGAPEALRQARAEGLRLAFVTNNASRTPAQVAGLLSGMGVPADSGDVVTSAQAAARLLSERVPAGASVLVIGGAGLLEAVREVGLRPVSSASEDPVAVVQGYGPDVGWRDLAEAAYAVAAGLPWVATNVDRTVPTPRGIAPGNGALVETVRIATGVDPVVAGKPRPPMHRETVIRTGARCPLVVGDRLDTDVEGAVAAGVDSLLVLSGVTTPRQLLLAPEGLRPTYLAAGLDGLLVAHPAPRLDGDTATCGAWTARVASGTLLLTGSDGRGPDSSSGHGSGGGSLDALRAACAVLWSYASDRAGTAAPRVDEALAAAGFADR